jgi:mannitol/fructose-specific phosphotransferase system IIA component (Ntr-type)
MPELLEYLTANRVIHLTATTKDAALNELVDVLVRDEPSLDRQTLADEIAKREAMMSTGIGNRLAIPHVRLAGVKNAAIAVGVSKVGITDYESLDQQPVSIVVMIIAPAGEHDTYIRLLARVADVLKDESMREAIIAADDTDTILDILIGEDAK